LGGKQKQTQDDTFCYYASGKSPRATPAVALWEQPVIGYMTPTFIVSRGQRVGDIWLQGRNQLEDNMKNLENVRAFLSYGH